MHLFYNHRAPLSIAARGKAMSIFSLAQAEGRGAERVVLPSRSRRGIPGTLLVVAWLPENQQIAVEPLTCVGLNRPLSGSP